MADAVMWCVLEELGAHGFSNLSVERVARAAEVNKTTIYRRWPTREALVAGALEYVLVDLESGEVDTGTLEGDLLALATAISEFATQPAGIALTRAAFAESAAPELAALASRQLARGASAPIAKLVARARVRGEWKSEAPPELAFSMLTGAILHRLMLEHQPAQGAWLTGVVALVAAGVRHAP